MKRVIILPLDGIGSAEALFAKLETFLQQEGIRDLLAFVKLNDGVHNLDMGGPAIISKTREILAAHNCPAGIFLDMKVFDVAGTLKNYAGKYAAERPDILTVSTSCTIQGIRDLRIALPETKLAMISALTDMPLAECRARFGQTPELKIYNDLNNITIDYQALYPQSQPFDLLVCSPKELAFLRRNLPEEIGFIVPGIRDAWMNADHQKRTNGAKEALDAGATYLVMGAQLTKGNPDQYISPETSQQLTLEQIALSRVTFDGGDLLGVLRQCDGYYRSPEDKDGKPLGPLVAYAGSYDSESGKKNFVGLEYFNFAKVEQLPRARHLFSKRLAKEIKHVCGRPSLVIGAPMGGIILAVDLSNIFDCRIAFAEKKVLVPADKDNGVKEKSELIIDRHEIMPGDKVVVIEDVCNNFSTTDKLLALIESRGAEVSGICCAINRSGHIIYRSKNNEDRPIDVVAACVVDEARQFQQDDSTISDLVLAGKVVWKPKQEWGTLKDAMEARPD